MFWGGYILGEQFFFWNILGLNLLYSTNGKDAMEKLQDGCILLLRISFCNCYLFVSHQQCFLSKSSWNSLEELCVRCLIWLLMIRREKEKCASCFINSTCLSVRHKKPPSPSQVVRGGKNVTNKKSFCWYVVSLFPNADFTSFPKGSLPHRETGVGQLSMATVASILSGFLIRGSPTNWVFDFLTFTMDAGFGLFWAMCNTLIKIQTWAIFIVNFNH